MAPDQKASERAKDLSTRSCREMLHQPKYGKAKEHLFQEVVNRPLTSNGSSTTALREGWQRGATGAALRQVFPCKIPYIPVRHVYLTGTCRSHSLALPARYPLHRTCVSCQESKIAIACSPYGTCRHVSSWDTSGATARACSAHPFL